MIFGTPQEVLDELEDFEKDVQKGINNLQK